MPLISSDLEEGLLFDKSFDAFLAERGVLGDISELKGIEIVLAQPERTVKDIATIFNSKDPQ